MWNLIGNTWSGGAYTWPSHIGWYSLEDKSNYEYYVTRSSLKNYTISIPSGHYKFYASMDISPSNDVAWSGQNLNGTPITPGTYYLYYIFHGIIAEPAPIIIKIIAINWGNQ